MAQIKATNTDKVLKIDKFLGVNECPDGDTNIEVGEASSMSNYKITSDLNLQKRPGTQNVASLLFNYTIYVGDLTTLDTDLNAADQTYTVYQNVDITDGGVLFPTGATATLNYSNHATYVDFYYQNINGNIYKFVDCVYTAATGGTAVTGGTVTIGATENVYGTFSYPITMYENIQIINGVVTGTSSYTASAPDSMNDGDYCSIGGAIRKYSRIGYLGGVTYTFYGYSVTVLKNDEYAWNFYPITVVPNTVDSQVRGIWSGRVGTEEYLCAACNNRLWALSETEGVWTKLNLGSVNTEAKVHLFGFDSKLYILNGTEYKQWDASTYKTYTYTADGTEADGNYYITVDSVNYKFALSGIEADDVLIFSENGSTLKLNGENVSYTTGSVTTETNLTADLVEATVYYPPIDVVGYRPLTHIGRSYDGTTAGTLLERINMLNGQRRVWFSPPGGQATFTLPETGLASIDYALTVATGAALTINSSSTVNGTVTLSAAPSAGTNTIEIGYTVSTTYRSTIEAMKLSEFFGVNDQTIMFYGDGSNEIYYSEIDYDGQARADYVPDLNVIHVGDSNTPVTDLIRHHNRLLAFKESSAYGISYDTLEVTYGSNTFVTSAFFLSTINRNIGSAGYGQAQLVDNKVRTLDGRSIYEWSATDSSGNVTADQRNAKVISDKVQNTLRELDFSNVVTFWDTINREYYIVENDIAIINNLENGTWYIYRNFPAICMIMYQDELYFGTEDGFIRHVSRNYLHDVGAAIDCYWESGAMDFGSANKRKYSDFIWTVLKPEEFSSINLTIVTDRMTDFEDEEVIADYSAVATGFFNYLNLNYEHFTYNINANPQTQRRKIKAKKFVWYKIIYSTASNDTTATLLKTEVKFRETGVAK